MKQVDKTQGKGVSVSQGNVYDYSKLTSFVTLDFYELAWKK